EQDPHIIVRSCLGWLGAAITLDGVHPLYLRNVYDKPTREEASHEQDMMTESGIIGSVLIATMAFGAAFTVPGGFVADDHGHAGTATLARRFAFRAFVVSDTMAFLCSLTATCFLIYGGVREIPRAHRYLYNLLASGLVPVGAQCMIAAFAFGFHLILGSVNRWLIVLVYTLSLASLLPWHLGSVPFGAGEGDMASSWMERTYQHTRVPKS
uniref:PGG domain-containing protein n=1 Tax=Aegilops tauschii subsp. strangulata TaxID=200361 RepID=A0A453BCT6_AEGTS